MILAMKFLPWFLTFSVTKMYICTLYVWVRVICDQLMDTVRSTRTSTTLYRPLSFSVGIFLKVRSSPLCLLFVFCLHVVPPCHPNFRFFFFFFLSSKHPNIQMYVKPISEKKNSFLPTFSQSTPDLLSVTVPGFLLFFPSLASHTSPCPGTATTPFPHGLWGKTKQTKKNWSVKIKILCR